jgi:G3E family GTPase
MEMLLDTLGCDLLRYKGLLNIAGEERRLLFQGVQQIYAADWERDWLADEERESRVVLIGMDLPEERIRAAFERAVARA